MNFDLSENQRSLREELARFGKGELSQGAMERDRTQSFSRDLWRALGERRVQGLPVPEACGGRGADPLTTAIALEGLAYGCDDGGLVFALGAHMLACVVPIWKHGTDEQRRRYLPGLCDGTLIAMNGMTEATSGSDAFSMSTVATPEEGGYRLNGAKTFISNGPVADVAVLYAATDPHKGYAGGTTAFIVERDSTGLVIEEKLEKMSLRSCLMGELSLENVFVPAEAVLGGVGGGGRVFSESMDWERIGLAATHVGRMERLLERCVQHARTRKAFGQAIGKFQAVSHRLADLKMELEAARLLTYRGAALLGTSRNVGLEAAITKTYASEALVRASVAAVEIFGALGILVEHDVERVLRDSMASTIYSGTNDMMRNITARWMGM